MSGIIQVGMERRGVSGTQVGTLLGTASSGGGDGCGVTHLGVWMGLSPWGTERFGWHHLPGMEQRGHDHPGVGGLMGLRGDGWDHLLRMCGVVFKGCWTTLGKGGDRDDGGEREVTGMRGVTGIRGWWELLAPPF